MSAYAHIDLPDVVIPTSLFAYVATRADDYVTAITTLVSRCPTSGLWIPVAGSLLASASLGICRFEATLLLRRDGASLSAVITASRWSVTLLERETWVDVEWPSEAMALAMHGVSVREQIDFPFLSPSLIVSGSETMGLFQRFRCEERDGNG